MYKTVSAIIDIAPNNHNTADVMLHCILTNCYSSVMVGLSEELKIRGKLTCGERNQQSYTYGYVTILYLQAEFQHIVCSLKIATTKMTNSAKSVVVSAATDSDNTII